MRVAAIDVGSNTVRLLVAALEDGSVRPVQEERTAVGLARDIERTGRIPGDKIERAARVARRYARDAAKAGASRIEVLITAPARQSKNGDELVDAIASATRLPVRPLSAEDEGRLAFAGVLSTFPAPPSSIAVCDVGGGSTQIAVGTASAPSWLRSVPLGSLRLTERCLVSDPPTRLELATARTEVAAAFSQLTPPLPAVGLATGGTARALRRYGLRWLDGDALESAIEELAGLSVVARAKLAKVDLERARTLPAGAIILTELHRVLKVPLGVADGGVREGVCTRLLEVEAKTA